MSKSRSNYSGRFKFQVALEAAKGLKTINQIASEHGVHPNLVSHWKRQQCSAGAQPITGNSNRLKDLNSMNRLGGSRWSWSG